MIENALKAFPNGAVYYTYLQHTLTNDHVLYLAHSSDFGSSWNTFLVDTLDRFGTPSLAFNDSEHGFLTAYADVIYKIQRDSLFAEVDHRAKENTLVKLFPNPTSNTFSLQSSVPIRHIEIYSIDNRLLQTIEAHSKSLSINTDGLQNGIYLVRLFSADGHLTTKKVIVL